MFQRADDDPPSLPRSTSARWNILCPALHLFHPSVGKRRQDTTDQFPISPSKTTPVTSSQSSAAFSSQQSPQNRLPATPLSRQIPIDGPAFTAFPRVLSSEAFGRRPYTGSTARARAGIRNPSGLPTFANSVANGKVAPKAAVHVTRTGRLKSTQGGALSDPAGASASGTISS